MAKGKLILICQSGGEFVTNDDGVMSYTGGEANAANVTSETPFNDLKLQLAEVCNLDRKTVTIKYFLPGNKKNLIVVKNDKDVKRMVDFHGDAITAEVFVMGTVGFDRSALDMQSNRESDTKKDETLNNDNVHDKRDESAKRGNARTKKNVTVKDGKVHAKKDDKVSTSPPYASPGKRTRRATAADKTEGCFDKNQEDNNAKSDDAKPEVSTDETSSSDASDHGNEKADYDSGSDYLPSRSASRRKRNSNNEVDVDASPADSVKKRRRTPSWKFGADGRPTIVSFPDNDSVGSKSRGKSVKAIAENSGGRTSQRKSCRLTAKGDSSTETKSGRKRGRRRSVVQEAGDSDQELEKESDSENLALTNCDDYVLPETTVGVWKSAITGAGQEFGSVNEFRAALKKYAIANRFGYKFKKNDTSRAIGGCAAEGCTWRFYAVWVPTTQSFMIKTLHNVHTCDKESRKSAHPAKNWLVGTIKDRLQESPYLKPREIANGLLQDFGVELNYTQVWRGIGDAREQLHGSPKLSYNKLPWFCEKLVEANPGSICKLIIGEKKRFKSLFVSFHASLCGFQNGCRPLIFLEAASLKSRYGEILLMAIAIDGNNGFIPVAFAIVDVEDDNNWHWFLEQLRSSILKAHPMTFVVDREKNLKKSVLEVFEDAHVGYSIYHLLASFKKNMKGPFRGDGKAFLPVHFLAAAHAGRPVGFKKSTEQIKLISSQAYDWVMQIEPEHWASSSFKGERYNDITEYVGETYAKLMEDYRHLPILQKIDALIRTIADDMEDARLDAAMWSTQLTATKEKQLEDEKLKARGLKVLFSSDTLFEVREDSTHVVDVSNWTCTCMGWRERGLPCCHALAVFSLTGKNPYDFCSSYFTADAYRLTYAESLCPIPIDGPLVENNAIVLEKEEAEGEKEGGNKETGGEMQKEDGSREDTEMEGTNKEEGEKMEVEKDEDKGSNVDGSKVDAKQEGSNVDTETEEGRENDVDAETEGGRRNNVGAEREEGGKNNGGAETEEGSSVDGEKEENESGGIRMEAKKDEGSNVDGEKEENESGGILVEAKKDEGSNVDGEKEGKESGGILVEAKKDSNVDGEKEGNESGGILVEAKKEEGKSVKHREEHEDPKVFVLPPIAARWVKKDMDGGGDDDVGAGAIVVFETEGEMKRKVTCSKCKQPGHYKKSCKTSI